MKKYSLVFTACIFTGSFADADKAANACSEGSAGPNGANFTETEKEGSTTLVFSDANGNTATLVPGDAFQPVYDTDGTTFKGYVAVDASIAKTWVEVTEG